jgi:hypothetical protein
VVVPQGVGRQTRGLSRILAAEDDAAVLADDFPIRSGFGIRLVAITT